MCKAIKFGQRTLQCKIWLGEEKIKEVIECKYLDTVLCKHGSMTGTVKEKAKKGRQVTGERNVSMEVKWGKRNRIFLSTLSYELGAWMWNEAQQLQIRAVELNLMISECGVSGWD